MAAESTDGPDAARRLLVALVVESLRETAEQDTAPGREVRTILDKADTVALSGTGTAIGQTVVAAVEQVIQALGLGRPLARRETPALLTEGGGLPRLHASASDAEAGSGRGDVGQGNEGDLVQLAPAAASSASATATPSGDDGEVTRTDPMASQSRRDRSR